MPVKCCWHLSTSLCSTSVLELKAAFPEDHDDYGGVRICF